MEATERLLIERECGRLVTLYCHYVDHGEACDDVAHELLLSAAEEGTEPSSTS